MHDTGFYKGNSVHHLHKILRPKYNSLGARINLYLYTRSKAKPQPLMIQRILENIISTLGM